MAGIQHACAECEAVYDSPAGLGSHRYHKHSHLSSRRSEPVIPPDPSPGWWIEVGDLKVHAPTAADILDLIHEFSAAKL